MGLMNVKLLSKCLRNISRLRQWYLCQIWPSPSYWKWTVTTQVKTHGNQNQIWQMQKRSSTTIKDVEIFNEDNNLDAFTLLLIVAFTPIFIAQLVIILLCQCTTIYWFDVRKSQWTANRTHLSQRDQQHHPTCGLQLWLRTDHWAQRSTRRYYLHIGWATLVKW